MKSVPGINWSMSLAVLRMAECEARASLPEATSSPSIAASRFSASTARTPPGSDSGKAMQEMEPFWTPWLPAPWVTMRQRAEGGIARHADGGLNLGEAAQDGLSRVGGQQRWVLALIGHMRLVGGRAPDPHLGHGHHHLEHVHVLDDIHQLGRGAAAGEAL